MPIGALQGEIMYDEFATIDSWLRREWGQELLSAAAAIGLPPTDETVFKAFAVGFEIGWHPVPLMLRQLVIAAVDNRQFQQQQLEVLVAIRDELQLMNVAQRNHGKV